MKSGQRRRLCFSWLHHHRFCRMMRRVGVLLLLLVSSLIEPAACVKRNDFKTCAQSGFCRRLRDLPVTSGKSSSNPYSIDVDSAHFESSTSSFTARINSAIYPEAHFQLSIGVTAEGLARIKVDEINGLRQRYNETTKWTIMQHPSPHTSATFDADSTGTEATLSWKVTTPAGTKSTRQARIHFNPLKLEFLRDGQVHVSFNEQNLFHMEHFRVKKVGDEPQDPPDVVIDENVKQARARFEPFMSEDGAWEETFGGHTDTKPKGPEAYSFDITFPGYQHVFGIPQHASPLSLRTTRGGEGAFTDPYRLYNADTFEYLADSEMSLYGSIPFMHAHRADGTVAVFSLTGSENWIDITKTSADTHTHWMTESGVLDLVVFLGPTNEEIFEQYAQLTGTTALPQMFAIGYHQCRWNYVSQEDVLQVSENFDRYDMPMDVMWLDVEYARDHMYFLWTDDFSQPEMMQDELAARGRQLVAIVDPHIKRVSEYYVYKEAQDLDILYKKADGKTEYEGWCWPGSSSWTDFFNPAAFKWWAGLFKYDKFKGSRPNLWVWNDMNEPAIFSGPEITAPKDNVHYGGWEHRDIHNINGALFHNATSQALIAREDPPRRPFVLSRAFFAGSQRYGAIWTGDNMCTWEHLAVATPMILANSIAGMTFNGADVGGFFGNPDEEILVRWYQAGAFYPFFRAHAHLDTKRREPYLFEEPTRGYIRDQLRLRYSLLPAWYTAFFHASLSGTPVIRPQYVAIPEDTAGFAVDDQYFVGTSGLLVRPIVTQGATEASVYLGNDEPYYDYFDASMYSRTSASRSRVTVPAPLSKLPLFQQGGSILTRRDIVRRSAPLMWKDPITLVVALDKTGTHAAGDIYLDDGDSFNFENGELVWRGFNVSALGKKSLMLESHDLVRKYNGLNKQFQHIAAAYNPDNAYAQTIDSVKVDDIVIYGLSSKPTCVKQPGQLQGLDLDWTEGVSSGSGSRKNGQTASVLRIKGAGLPVTKDWQVVLDFDKSKACEHVSAVSFYKALEDPTCGAPGMYRCPNEGHFSACILTSRVNDGICDPECCDGSDERDGKVHCPNRCSEVHKEYQAKKDEEARIQRVGNKLRQDWSRSGLKEKSKIEKNIARMEAELASLREKEQSLRIILDRIESSEASEIERKKASKMYQRLVEHQKTIESLRKHRAYLQQQIGDLTGLLVELKKTFNPNYQDMAVLGAVRAFDDWRRANGYEITEPDPVNPTGEKAAEQATPVQAVEVDFDDLAEDFLKGLEEEDVLSLLAELDSSPTQEAANLLFRVEEYLPDALKEHYNTLRVRLLDLLANTGVISRKVVEDAERPDVSKARSVYQSAEKDLSNAEKKLQSERALLEKDWGSDWAWKKLDGECIDKDVGEYVYELCWFKNARQKSKGGSSTNMGKFASWDPEKAARSPESYFKQIYNDGQKCWNGPERSVTVDLVCGTSNVLLSVMEPEKCIYHFKVQTPAVCAIEEPAGEAKSEL